MGIWMHLGFWWDRKLNLSAAEIYIFSNSYLCLLQKVVVNGRSMWYVWSWQCVFQSPCVLRVLFALKFTLCGHKTAHLPYSVRGTTLRGLLPLPFLFHLGSICHFSILKTNRLEKAADFTVQGTIIRSEQKFSKGGKLGWRRQETRKQASRWCPYFFEGKNWRLKAFFFSFFFYLIIGPPDLWKGKLLDTLACQTFRFPTSSPIFLWGTELCLK